MKIKDKLRAAALVTTLLICAVSVTGCGESSENETEITTYDKKENTQQYTKEENAELGITVVIDPGHGGSDPGNIMFEDTDDEVYEKEINIAVALVLRDMLEDSGINVVMTREEDEFLYLSTRYEIANSNKADLFVSIHCNAYEDDESVNGAEVHYYPGSDESEKFGEYIDSAFIESTGANSREMKATKLVVLSYAEMPAVRIYDKSR